MSEQAIVKSIRMLPRSIDAVENIKEKTRSPSFSDTVKNAIDITEMLVRHIESGDKIIVQKKGGRKTEILIHGISR